MRARALSLAAMVERPLYSLPGCSSEIDFSCTTDLAKQHCSACPTRVFVQRVLSISIGSFDVSKYGLRMDDDDGQFLHRHLETIACEDCGPKATLGTLRRLRKLAVAYVAGYSSLPNRA